MKAIDQIDALCIRMRTEARFIYCSREILRLINAQIISDNGVMQRPLSEKERKADLARYKLSVFKK